MVPGEYPSMEDAIKLALIEEAMQKKESRFMIWNK